MNGSRWLSKSFHGGRVVLREHGNLSVPENEETSSYVHMPTQKEKIEGEAQEGGDTNDRGE
jgi:hypothetical protein